jgi:hypothetical protein
MTTWREWFTVRRRYPNPVDQRRRRPTVDDLG